MSDNYAADGEAQHEARRGRPHHAPAASMLGRASRLRPERVMTETRLYDLRVEPDPAMIGPRGAIYGWRVVTTNNERVVYESGARIACLAFVDGVRFDRSEAS